MIPFRNRDDFVNWKKSKKGKCYEHRLINDIYYKLIDKDDGQYTRDPILLNSIPYIYNFFYNKGFAVSYSIPKGIGESYIYVSTGDFVLKNKIIKRAKICNFIYLSYRRFKTYKYADKNAFKLILSFLPLIDVIPEY